MKKQLSIRKTIIIVSIWMLLSTVSIVTGIVLYNWYVSVQTTISTVIDDMSSNIENQMDIFLEKPEDILINGNYLIRENIIDVDNSTELFDYFTTILKNDDNEIYSIGYATEQGEYYGEKIKENGEVEIIRNNILESTFDSYNPKNEEWYMLAIENHNTVFLDNQTQDILNNIAISISNPVYNNEDEIQGVLVAHVVLSSCSVFLESIAQEKNGFTMVFEKNTGYLIANSEEEDNYFQNENDEIVRLTPKELDNPVLREGYQNYLEYGEENLDIDDYKIKAVLYEKNGMEWVIVEAIPIEYLMIDVRNNIELSIMLIILISTIALAVYVFLIRKYFHPLFTLIKITKKFKKGEFDKKIKVVRNDEIGELSNSFNEMADTINGLVNHLEDMVEQRTLELKNANILLNESKINLGVILNSTAEGLIGVDLEGNCTFCNESGMYMLGFLNMQMIIGKNINTIFQHASISDSDTEEFIDYIMNAIQTGTEIHSDQGVILDGIGNEIEIEIFSYPQYRDDKIIGAVLSFFDVSIRKKNERHIEYLNYHDWLTGLYNRRFYEENISLLNIPENLPISIIFGDINGLKLTNDVFGHTVGDKLIKCACEKLQDFFGENGIIARIGGDEFIVILPKTTQTQCEKSIAELKNCMEDHKINAIKCSMAIGSATKTTESQNIIRIIEDAENKMYYEKNINRSKIDEDLINTIISSLHEKNKFQKIHSEMVSKLCVEIGEKMNLPKSELHKLKELGYLHDIGKIVLSEEEIYKEEFLKGEEMNNHNFHPIVGYRILSLFDKTLDIAIAVYAHHENWDGTGYPKHLKATEIPFHARILAVAEFYIKMVNSENEEFTKRKLLEYMEKQSGVFFDPEIIKVFLDLKGDDVK